MLAGVQRIYWYLWRNYQKACLASCGRGVHIGRYCTFTYGSVSVWDDVYIGSGAVFQSAHGKIVIGSHVMFGPHVHIHGGDHTIHVVGQYMKEVAQKAPGSDGVVRICDDVWVGANVTILKGVTIGEGSVIGAGSVIARDVDSHAVVVGCLPRKDYKRWDEEVVARHKVMLAKRESRRDGTCSGGGSHAP